MVTLSEESVLPLARSMAAMGRIIEAHADQHDRVRKVVVEMNDGLNNLQLRDAMIQLWYDDGFLASISQDGYLIIEGTRHQEPVGSMELVNAVAHQIRCYSRSSMQEEARRDMTGMDELMQAAAVASGHESEAELTH